MAQAISSGERTYLSINAKGEFFESSKDMKEGFVEVKKEDGGIVYHKLYKSTDLGKITFLQIVEKTFKTGPAKYFIINITNSETNAIDSIQIPLLKMAGGISDTVKKVIAILPHLEYSSEYQIGTNRKANAKGFIDKVLFFGQKVGEEILTTKSALKFGEGGDVPGFEVEEDLMDSSKLKYNYTKQDKYLAEVMKYELQRFTDFKVGNIYPSKFSKLESTETVAKPEVVAKPETTKEPKKTKVVQEPITEDTDEDLPF